MNSIEQSIKCLECSYDLTLLFEFDEWNKPKFIVRICPDCNTANKLITDRKASDPWGVEVITKKASKPLKVGNDLESSGYVDVSEKELHAIQSLKPSNENNYITRCLVCMVEVSLYLSYLVKLQTSIFPKIEEKIETLSPAGNIVEEIKTTYLPPVREKGRICNSCFNKLPISDFTSGRVELLPDPMNMTRDGIRNVKDAPQIRYERDIIEKEEHLILAIGAVKDDDIIIEFPFGNKVETQTMIGYTNKPSNEVIKPRKAYPLRPSKINVVLHPSRRVRRINIPSFSEVEFTSKDRRASFKRWFENG